MKTYVYRLNGNRDTLAEGSLLADGGVFVDFGWYVFINDDEGNNLDIAGPFPDEIDALEAECRALEWAS